MEKCALTEHHLEFLSLKGGYTVVSESTIVKMPHCWNSHVAAQLYILFIKQYKSRSADFLGPSDQEPHCFSL